MQELAEDSQSAKGSLTSIVEDSYSDRRRKKPAEPTGNLRNESLERSIPSWKDASGAAHHKPRPKARPKLVEKVSYDVSIPKNITVANLARLLGIKQSALHHILPFTSTSFTDLPLSEVLQHRMSALGMANTDYDYSESRCADHSEHHEKSFPVLSSDNAYVLALEFDRNPIVDDEAAFDLYPL